VNLAGQRTDFSQGDEDIKILPGSPKDHDKFFSFADCSPRERLISGSPTTTPEAGEVASARNTANDKPLRFRIPIAASFPHGTTSFSPDGFKRSKSFALKVTSLS